MTVRVASLCWGTAWERYGRKFAETFERFWPKEVELVLVTDRIVPLPRGRISLLYDIPGYEVFIAKYWDDPRAKGMKPPPGTRKLDANGYSWRHDAMKWMPQAVAPLVGIEGLKDGDIFVWFDADTTTIAPVPSGWVESLLGDADVACLQRPEAHSEIGFYAMRMGPNTRSALNVFANFYTYGAVFHLSEWHSAYVWDRSIEAEPGLRIRNLNTANVRGHPWPTTELAKYTMHHKGKRKGS